MPNHLVIIKKLCLSSVFIAFVFICPAQGPQFLIFAGPQMTSAKYTINGVKQPTDYKFGFQAGVGMKVPFETNLFFSPAIFYSLKGYKVKFNRPAYPPDLMAADNNATVHTVELAFLLQYDMGKQANHFFLRAGPSLDFQLKGKEKFNLLGGGSVSQNMIFSFGEYGHYSANLLIQPGFETRGGFTVSAQYTLGLASINNADDGPIIKYHIYGISIGKYLNNKKIVIDTRNKE
jgi:hypothetical protein